MQRSPSHTFRWHQATSITRKHWHLSLGSLSELSQVCVAFQGTLIWTLVSPALWWKEQMQAFTLCVASLLLWLCISILHKTFLVDLLLADTRQSALLFAGGTVVFNQLAWAHKKWAYTSCYTEMLTFCSFTSVAVSMLARCCRYLPFLAAVHFGNEMNPSNMSTSRDNHWCIFVLNVVQIFWYGHICVVASMCIWIHVVA